jgi:hypothetical protein
VSTLLQLSNSSTPDQSSAHGLVTALQAENAVVVPLVSVAVAVMELPTPGPATEKVNVGVLPVASVVTGIDPRKIVPSPNPLALQDVLEKNSIVNVVLAVLLRLPVIVVVPLPLSNRALAMTG